MEDNDYSRLGNNLEDALKSDEYLDSKATMEILALEVRRMKKDKMSIYNIDHMGYYYKWAKETREKTEQVYSIYKKLQRLVTQEVQIGRA